MAAMDRTATMRANRSERRTITAFLVLVSLLVLSTPHSCLLALGHPCPRCFSSSELSALGLTPTDRFASGVDGPVTLERNGWAGHFVTSATAAILLEETMGYEVVFDDQIGATVYEGCGRPRSDRLNFEVWPLSLSRHPARGV
jgi:hypothetical protein